MLDDFTIQERDLFEKVDENQDGFITAKEFLKIAKLLVDFGKFYFEFRSRPFLFLEYINDLPLASNLKTRLFADDVNLTLSHRSSDIL